MAVTFGASGTASGGSISLTLAYPAGITAGQLLVLYVVNKYPANGPTTPANWTLISQASGGVGSAGADSGTVFTNVYYMIAAGTESGNLSVTIPSGNAALGMISRYTHSGGNWSIASTSGSVNVKTVSWSVTGASDPGIVGDDMVLVCSGVNTDAHSVTAEAITATGVTFGTAVERADTTTFVGDQIGLWISEHPVLAGNSSTVPVYTSTLSGATGTNEPGGASVIVRIREVPGLNNNYQFLKVGDGMSVSEKIR